MASVQSEFKQSAKKDVLKGQDLDLQSWFYQTFKASILEDPKLQLQPEVILLSTGGDQRIFLLIKLIRRCIRAIEKWKKKIKQGWGQG